MCPPRCACSPPSSAVPTASTEPAGAGAGGREPGSVLSRRFFWRIAGVSVGLLLLAGSLEAVFGYHESREQLARLQGLQAQAAGAEIEQYLRTVERSLQQVQALPWGQAGFGPPQRREELQRLLALNPALVSLADADAQGRELLVVSRIDTDRGPAKVPALPVSPSVASSATAAASPPPAARASYATPFFDDTGVPNVRLMSVRAGQPAGLTTAVLNLRFLADVVSGLRVADGGEVFIVDGAGQLIAHADPTQTLRQLRLQGHAVVTAARQGVAQGRARLEAVAAPGLNGTPAITTAIALPASGWLLFVEQPRAQAMQPVLATVQRTLGLLAIAVLVATLASAGFARRMAMPIARLRRATAEMAAGQLRQRLRVHTGDEIEGLAEDFNVMSSRLQQSYGELEQKVQARTAELALRRDEAERANAAKTRFLATASHDLRQPMHAIGLLVGVLRERLAEQDLRGLVDKTHQAVQAMEGLFGSLLDVSKLDAGAVQPQPSAFALQDLLRRVEASYAPLAAAKAIGLRVRPTAAVVFTDPALLERVLGNLIANAIRYTHQGGVLVACRRRGEGLLLQVFDTGVGIAADQLELIFEEFVRLGGGHPGDQGLGLGLAIVKRTAALLGLPLQVHSCPGRGSVFSLLLPLALVRDANPSSLPNPLPEALRQRVRGAFVLVVDDDARNLEATAALLLQWGCLVATAGTAAAALAEAERHLRPPDVLISDLRLGPGQDGTALIRSLRAEAGLAVPALLVTADTQWPLPLDADIQVLQKPVGAARLLGALAKALQAPGPV